MIIRFRFLVLAFGLQLSGVALASSIRITTHATGPAFTRHERVQVVNQLIQSRIAWLVNNLQIVKFTVGHNEGAGNIYCVQAFGGPGALPQLHRVFEEVAIPDVLGAGRTITPVESCD